MWGENGQGAGLESALSPLPLIPELGDTEGLESGRVTACPFYQRDLPYSWETFLENVMVSLNVVCARASVDPGVTVIMFSTPRKCFASLNIGGGGL